jgi:hypothetical protein
MVERLACANRCSALAIAWWSAGFAGDVRHARQKTTRPTVFGARIEIIPTVALTEPTARERKRELMPVTIITSFCSTMNILVQE